MITASVSDSPDGLMRLIGDVQRFGFSLAGVTAIGHKDASMWITMTILADTGPDCAHIRSRLARHPTIRTLEAVEVGHGAAAGTAAPSCGTLAGS